MSPRPTLDDDRATWPNGSRTARRWTRQIDVAVAASMALVAALATTLPPGVIRTALTLPVLLFVPGYLLIQALRPASGRPLQDVLMGLGLSLPVLGLAALLTSVFPGGFTRVAIIATVTVTCLVLALAAALRRRSVPAEAPAAAGVPAE